MNNYTEDKSTGTIMLIPEFGSNYYYRAKENIFSVGIQLGYPLVGDPEDDLEFSGNGISFQFSVGYKREVSPITCLGVELGYQYVPVDINTVNNSYYYQSYSTHETKNFGGVLIKLIYSYSLGK